MTTGLQKTAQENLKRIIEQIERIDEERKGLSADISDKMKEAKNAGFDTKIIRQILKLRKQSQSEREEAESLLSVYLSALGMLPTQTDMMDAPERELETA